MTSPPATITSLTNPRVKAAVRLRDRREREATGLTIVDGPRELLRALDAGVEVAEAFVCEALVRTPEAERAVSRLPSGAQRLDVAEAVMGKVGFGDRSDGIVAIVRSPRWALPDITLPDNPLIVVIEGVEKPGNLGRSCGRPTGRAPTRSSPPIPEPTSSIRARSGPVSEPSSAGPWCHQPRLRPSTG